MKFTPIALVGLSLAHLVSFAFVTPTAEAQRDGGAEGELAAHMGDLKQSLRKLGGMVEDEAQMAASLEEICRLQKVVIDAKSETPSTVSSIEDEKKQRKAALKYRSTMQDLLRAFLDLESAVAAGDAKKAKKAMRAFDKLESAGHSEFKPRNW